MNSNEQEPEGQAAKTAEGQPADELYDELYDRYARPLEAEHWGEFMIIAPDGRYVLGDSLLAAMERAELEIGLGNYGYRIGTRYVGEIL
ncbi:MAG TPA: hypothetical protein VFD32_01640 [Dehalococcoidia bacterium]|nr:hypothetical protein [Dehalococcoidia bacterium]